AFNEGLQLLEDLQEIPHQAEALLKLSDQVRAVAEKYAHHEHFFYLGRKYNYPVALEGALKLKEISYSHAEGYAAGEMKHGPIALIDEQMPVVVVMPRDAHYEKTLGNVQEVRARDGRVIAIATDDDEEAPKLAEHVL